MIKFILILTLIGDADRPAIHSIEFNSMESCAKAADAYKYEAKANLNSDKVIAICAPK